MQLLFYRKPFSTALSLRLRSISSHTLSMLRYLALRKPKISLRYATSFFIGSLSRLLCRYACTNCSSLIAHRSSLIALCSFMSFLLASNRQQHHTYNNQHKVEGLVFEVLFAHKECAGKEGDDNR